MKSVAFKILFLTVITTVSCFLYEIVFLGKYVLVCLW